MACRFQRVADGGRAPVLPDNGGRDRICVLAVPNERRLALVGDANGGNPVNSSSLGDDCSAYGQCARPDLVTLLLHPAIGGVLKGNFLLRERDFAKLAVIDNRAGRGGAFVDDEDEISHGSSLHLPHGFRLSVAPFPAPSRARSADGTPALRDLTSPGRAGHASVEEANHASAKLQRTCRRCPRSANHQSVAPWPQSWRSPPCLPSGPTPHRTRQAR